MYPDNDYEDDLQDELEELARDKEMGIRGWDFADNIGSNGDDEPLSLLELHEWDYDDDYDDDLDHDYD